MAVIVARSGLMDTDFNKLSDLMQKIKGRLAPIRARFYSSLGRVTPTVRRSRWHLREAQEAQQERSSRRHCWRERRGR